MKEEILRFENVTQIEEEVTLLDNFNLNIFKGEIMGLVCINDHGKESFMQLLLKNLPIHFGRIYFQEELVNYYGHSTLSINRVSIIEKRSRLIEALTISDNIFVMRRGFKKYIVSPKVLNTQLNRFTEGLKIQIDGKQLVADLDPYEKCVVELLKAVVMGVKLVIIRDISNFISASNLSEFQELLRHYCERGLSVLYICNHHEEAFKICTRISLMRDGKILKVLDQKQFADEKIYPFITDFSTDKILKSNLKVKTGLLQFQNVVTEHLQGMNLTIEEGECTVILDINNTSLMDFLNLMNGTIVPWYGEIYLDHVLYTRKMSKGAITNGVCFIAESPNQSMLFREMTYIENLCFLVNQKKDNLQWNKRVKKSVIKEYEPLIGEDIHQVNIDHLKPASLYNLVYYRIHLCHPKLVFLVQPFAGADMYLRRHIIELINQLKKKGITVVILAMSISDSLIVADRLMLVEQGQFINNYHSTQFSIFRSKEITPENM